MNFCGLSFSVRTDKAGRTNLNDKTLCLIVLDATELAFSSMGYKHYASNACEKQHKTPECVFPRPAMVASISLLLNRRLTVKQLALCIHQPFAFISSVVCVVLLNFTLLSYI